MNLLLLILIVLILLSFGGWGYGYSRGGVYANPLGLLGLLLIIGLVIWLFAGGGFAPVPPP